jgi:TonB family protein
MLQHPLAKNFYRALFSKAIVVAVLGSLANTVMSQEHPAALQYRVKRQVYPEYPQSARVAGVCGRVTAEIYINPNGRASSVSIIEALPGGVFEKSVQKAISQMEFEILPPNPLDVPLKVKLRFAFVLPSESGTGSDCKNDDPK